MESALKLHPASNRLIDGAGRIFDPATRLWTPAGHPVSGEPLDLAEAVRWLQRDSGRPCPLPIGVIGPRDATPSQMTLAEAVGVGLAGLGLTVLCGGKQGVMEAVCRGAARTGGLSVGLLPDDDWEAANPYVGLALATGIGVARNAVIARAALALIAVGGGHGTLSEIAFGLQFGRPVFGLEGAPAVEGLRSVADWTALEPEICRLVLAL